MHAHVYPKCAIVIATIPLHVNLWMCYHVCVLYVIYLLFSTLVIAFTVVIFDSVFRSSTEKTIAKFERRWCRYYLEPCGNHVKSITVSSIFGSSVYFSLTSVFPSLHAVCDMCDVYGIQTTYWSRRRLLIFVSRSARTVFMIITLPILCAMGVLFVTDCIELNRFGQMKHLLMVFFFIHYFLCHNVRSV